MKQPTGKQRIRWRFRLTLRLRTLLATMLLLGCGFGFLARWINLARKQRTLVEKIESLGGAVCYDFQFDADWKPEQRFFFRGEKRGFFSLSQITVRAGLPTLSPRQKNLTGFKRVAVTTCLTM